MCRRRLFRQNCINSRPFSIQLDAAVGSDVAVQVPSDDDVVASEVVKILAEILEEAADIVRLATAL